MTFGSSQVCDIVAYVGEAELWRWSGGRAFAAIFGERSFPPGVALLERESWDLRDNAGATLPAGTYRVVASLAATRPRAGNVLEISLTAP